jgi:hypothetical protein
MNLLVVDGYKVQIKHHAFNDLFCDEIRGLSGAADFTVQTRESDGSEGRPTIDE